MTLALILAACAMMIGAALIGSTEDDRHDRLNDDNDF